MATKRRKPRRINGDKPRMGRIPIPRPGNEHRDRSKYRRKPKHKKGTVSWE